MPKGMLTGQVLLGAFEKWLADELGADPEDLVNLDEVPDAWKQYPLCWSGYGERGRDDIRVDGIYWDDTNQLKAIRNLISNYHHFLVDLVNFMRLQCCVEPSEGGDSKVLIIAGRYVVLARHAKASHTAYETPQELMRQLQKDCETILTNMREIERREEAYRVLVAIKETLWPSEYYAARQETEDGSIPEDYQWSPDTLDKISSTILAYEESFGQLAPRGAGLEEGRRVKVAIEIADGEVIGVQGDCEGELVIVDHDFDRPVVTRWEIEPVDVEGLVKEV
jgi:hypothetical protein